MRRREFITLFGGAAATASVSWLHTASAQQAAKPRTIGFMGASAPAAVSTRVAAFVQRLHELGWIEGGNVVIEYRWAEGRFERLAGFAADFVLQGSTHAISFFLRPYGTSSAGAGAVYHIKGAKVRIEYCVPSAH